MTEQIEKALRAIEKTSEDWSGPCRECRWCIPDLVGRRWDKCGSPVESALSFKPDRGFGDVDELVECKVSRQESGRCKPQGLFFEPLPLFSFRWLSNLFS